MLSLICKYRRPSNSIRKDGVVQPDAEGGFGDRFTIYKFRTMTTREVTTKPTGEDNEQFTRSVRYLRQTYLDEIPQLWLILGDDMSAVAPELRGLTRNAISKLNHKSGTNGGSSSLA